MPELRKDFLTDNWVIISEERDDRPQDFERHHVEKKSSDQCPFEPGHEEMTPPEIDRFSSRNGDDSDWLVRVIPNKYEAFSSNIRFNKSSEGIFQKMSASGGHEVVIESPQHNLNLYDFDSSQYYRVVEIFKRRLTQYRRDNKVQYIQILRNKGYQAGASLVHPHSQIVAFPFIPEGVKTRLRHSGEYFQNNEKCFLCEMIETELKKSTRIIQQNKYFISLAPYSSRYPYETWIVPKRHSNEILGITNQEQAAFSRILPDTLKRLNGVIEDPPYNLLFHDTAYPFENNSEKNYLQNLNKHHHWHLEVIPRLKRTAGLELATRTHINTVSPETAARMMKTVSLD